MSETVKCIDISHWQGFPDFEEVRASGVLAMIHKATEGTGYADPNRARNCSNAIAAGISTATYHWLKPGGNAADQMKYYLDVVQPVAGERVVIDYEEDGCQLDDLLDAVEALLDAGGDLGVTVYSGHLLKEQISGERNAFLAENTDLWLAQYTSGTPTWPSETYPQWSLWQFSETGNVVGIDDAYVDLNRYNGSDAELIAWIKPAGAAPTPPVPVPQRDTVYVAVIAPDSVKVKVKVLSGTRLLGAARHRDT
jgi:lysozyme